MRSEPKSERWRRWLWIAGSFTLGLGAVIWVVRQAGVDATLAVIARALPFLPCVVLLEACRIGTEALAARDLFASLKASVPVGALVRAQLVGYSIGNVLPVGRMAAEASKAGLLKSHATLPKTAAVAAVVQALHLIASAIILLPCVVAARSAQGSVALSFVILGQCALLAASGSTLLLLAYFAPLGSLAFVRFPKIGAALEQFRSALRQLPGFPASALGWLVLNRTLQVVLIGILLHAVGSRWSLSSALVAQGVLLIGATAGDFVPGQIGALEGAFTVFAWAMGTTPRNGLAVALLIHLVQSLWVLGGFLALGVGRARTIPSRKSADVMPGPSPLLQPPFAARLDGRSAFKAS